MISVPVARTKGFRLPQRAKPTVLDEERSFLSRIVRQLSNREPVRDKVASRGRGRIR
jgi:hypothetical protein